MLNTGYKEIKQQSYQYKGYIAENFVAQELSALGIEPSFSWNDARSEIEFLLSDDLGNIIPVEVKSGRRTKARSLQSYINKCQPKKTLKLTGTQGSPVTEKKHFVLPLYFTQYVTKLL